MFKLKILNSELFKFISFFTGIFLLAFLIPPLLLISLVSYYLYFSKINKVLKYSLIFFNTLLGIFFTVLYYLSIWYNFMNGTNY